MVEVRVERVNQGVGLFFCSNRAVDDGGRFILYIHLVGFSFFSVRSFFNFLFLREYFGLFWRLTLTLHNTK